MTSSPRGERGVLMMTIDDKGRGCLAKFYENVIAEIQNLGRFLGIFREFYQNFPQNFLIQDKNSKLKAKPNCVWLVARHIVY